MQYLVLHINQGLKDLDIENYKILMKNVEDKTNKQTTITPLYLNPAKFHW